MAIKLKAKPKQISRSAIKTIDDKAYGSEPIEITSLGDALNWYNYMYDNEKAKGWILEYMKKEGYSKSDIAAVRRAPKHATITTVGWLVRIQANGNKLTDGNLDFIISRIETMIKAGGKETVETVETPKPVVSIQDRVQAKIYQLITECEEAVDTIPNLNIYEWLTTKEATAQAASAIREFYSKWSSDHEYDEFDTKAVKKARDEQKKYWEDFVLAVDRYINNKKAVKVRKPREKKVKSAVEVVKNMKFQKDDMALKVVSVHPAEIVGCNQLWVYNTKYKKLMQYNASGPAGIQVKGTTLIGYDQETSLSKGLRKPDITIQSLLSAGKVGLRKFMDELKTTSSTPNGRINEQTILLRVIK